MAAAFSGLPKDFFAFFKELAKNNERPWFEANKDRYKNSVVGPLQDLILAMQPRLAKISKHIVADPRPVGGSLFRIYRDTRFSKDKSPYKTNAGVHFRHAAGKDAHVPGFYLHLAPDEVFFGGGIWMPEADALAKIRHAIAGKSSKWAKVSADPAFKKTFGSVGGEGLARPPKGFDPEHPFIEDLKRKSFFAMRDSTPAETQGPKFADTLAATFANAKPLMKFLCDALEQPF